MLDNKKFKELQNKLNSISSPEDHLDASVKNKIKSLQQLIIRVQQKFEEKNMEN